MRRGVLAREAELATRQGRLLVRSRRLASLADPHLIALELELTVLEGSVELTPAPAARVGPPALPRRNPRGSASRST